MENIFYQIFNQKGFEKQLLEAPMTDDERSELINKMLLERRAYMNANKHKQDTYESIDYKETLWRIDDIIYDHLDVIPKELKSKILANQP